MAGTVTRLPAVSVALAKRAGANAVVIGPTTPQALPPLDRTIQDAIDAAGSNDLIMVRPSIYNELVVMWKPIQLQGFGEGQALPHPQCVARRARTGEDVPRTPDGRQHLFACQHRLGGSAE